MGIKVENLTKSFEGKKILNNISFEVNDGDFATLLAPTGEGKTTLLRIMAGVEQPDSGRLYFDDKDVTDIMVQNRRIAMGYQWFVNYPSMTVYDNIATPLQAIRPKLTAGRTDQNVRRIGTQRLLESNIFRCVQQAAACPGNGRNNRIGRCNQCRGGLWYVR